MSSLKCTVSVDSIAKEADTISDHLYKYRKSLVIPPLQMVDDQLAVSPCGMDAVITNAFMNAQTNLKRMQYGANKCFRLHIGKNCNLCSDLNVDTWDSVMEDFTPKSVWDLKDVVGPQHALETVDSTKYLGDIME